MHRPSTSRARRLRVICGFLIYAIAVFVAAVLAFGPLGLVPGLLVPIVWGYVLWNPRPQVALLHVLLYIVLALILTALCLPSVQQAREASRRTLCRNNLKQIGLALHNYHDVFGSFPPAYTVDAGGRPLLSWRVLILPYLNQAQLYEEFHVDEPWDSPHNVALVPRMPDVYTCPERLPERKHPSVTSYVAVVGDATIWPPGGQVTHYEEIKDGSSNTLMIVEFNSDILWSAPRDLDFDAALDEFTADSADDDFRSHHRYATHFVEHYINGRHVLIADGSVSFGGGGDREFWRSLFTVNDGQPEAGWNFPGSRGSYSRLRLEHVVPVILFFVLSLLPVAWVWRQGGRRSPDP